MDNDDILNQIPWDILSDTISTRVWSFTKERAVEKALNRIDFRARGLGRQYVVMEEPVARSANPDDATETWECFMRAQLL
jgi:hypothetical protein